MNILRPTKTAEKIGTHVRTLWRYARDPSMNFPPPIRIGPGVTGFDEEAVNKWLEARAALRDGPKAA